MNLSSGVNFKRILTCQFAGEGPKRFTLPLYFIRVCIYWKMIDTSPSTEGMPCCWWFWPEWSDCDWFRHDHTKLQRRNFVSTAPMLCFRVDWTKHANWERTASAQGGVQVILVEPSCWLMYEPNKRRESSRIRHCWGRYQALSKERFTPTKSKSWLVAYSKGLGSDLHAEGFSLIVPDCWLRRLKCR